MSLQIILFFYQTRFLLLFIFDKYFLSRATNIAVHILGITHKWYPSEHPVTLGFELQMSWFQKVLTSKSKIGFHLVDFNVILFCSISCTTTVLHILNKALCNTVKQWLFLKLMFITYYSFCISKGPYLGAQSQAR